MKVGVLGSKSKVKDDSVIEELLAKLQAWGYETTRFFKHPEIEGVDAVIVLGGDGAILHASLTAARNGVKVIGINYGNLGFLTEYEKEEWEKLKDMLDGIRNGTCRILKRSLLQVEINGKVYFALNEVAMQRDYGLYDVKTKQILRLQMETKEGTDVISGDGVLVCTPTGSTAYSLSAGGAILTPEVPVFMMTPICAFSMRTRPIVFSDEEIFKFKVTKGKAILFTDGYAVGIMPENAEVKIKKAPFTADFPVRESSDFFAKVRNKLNE